MRFPKKRNRDMKYTQKLPRAVKHISYRKNMQNEASFFTHTGFEKMTYSRASVPLKSSFSHTVVLWAGNIVSQIGGMAWQLWRGF
jgi:hypothetical protein